MRQHLATLALSSTLAGCSLIYNPSNLPDREMPVDAPIADADPSMLQLTEVRSPSLLEGAGQDGSAPQVLVVFGHHILENATLTVEPKTPNPNVAIQVSDVVVAKDRNSIAALVRAGYMDMVDETGANMAGEIELTITVTQPGAEPRTLDWKLKPLDQLTTTGMNVAPPPANKLFSRVQIMGDVDFMPGAGRVILRAVGGISISGRISANASGRTGGAGGCEGGAGGGDGACHGGGKNPGGGAGFVNMGGDGGQGTGGAISGNELVPIYDGVGAAMNKGAGGGGAGAVGGGGGGTIELTAGGDVTVTTVQANAAAGGNGGLGSGGGGGAGGVVVMRAGNQVTYPMALSVGGGGGGPGTLGSGGAGSIGRWRIDTDKLAGTQPTVDADTPAPRRGPMIVRPASTIFNTKQPTLMIAGKTGDMVQLIALYADGTSETTTATMTSDVFPAKPPELQIGLNTVCVIVPGGNFANDEAKNCLDVAFLP